VEKELERDKEEHQEIVEVGTSQENESTNIVDERYSRDPPLLEEGITQSRKNDSKLWMGL
jgi:hypothetical protein